MSFVAIGDDNTPLLVAGGGGGTRGDYGDFDGKDASLTEQGGDGVGEHGKGGTQGSGGGRAAKNCGGGGGGFYTDGEATTDPQNNHPGIAFVNGGHKVSTAMRDSGSEHGAVFVCVFFLWCVAV